MNKEKQIQIPERLFVEICQYFLLDRRDQDMEKSIERGINDKLDSIVKHELYTRYKTAATPEQAEQARQKYLDKAGISKDFRW